LAARHTATRVNAVQLARRRLFHNSRVSQRKVTVVGAAGGIGQPLSLLLKQSPLVTELRLYDVAPITPGVAADLSHIDTPAKVIGFGGGPEELAKALQGAEVVVVPAGVPRKPNMTRDDLFNINAGIVRGIAESVAVNAPNAALCIISNPVNSAVPIVAETLKKHGKFNPRKLFGVTTLDVLRANTFVAEAKGKKLADVNVPVVGGHAGITILPLLSQVPNTKFTPEEKEALTHRIMFGGDEVVKAKAGGGSATLSMAAAGARFATNIIRALNGEKGVIQCSYVYRENGEPARYFASPVEFGVNGIEKIHDIGKLDEFEQKKLAEALPELKEQIEKGEAFVTKS